VNEYKTAKVIKKTPTMLKANKAVTSHAGSLFATRKYGWRTAASTTAAAKAPIHHRASPTPPKTAANTTRNDHMITALEPTNPPRAKCSATGTTHAIACWVHWNSSKRRKRKSTAMPAIVKTA
jgi:hypothetical protein